jgi:hypothetical protein
MTMTRSFLAFVMWALFATGAAMAQNQLWGPFPAAEVQVFLEKHPQHRGAFLAKGDAGMFCNDEKAAKAFMSELGSRQLSPTAAQISDSGNQHTLEPATMDPAIVEMNGQAIRQRMMAIDEALKSKPSNTKALLAERERLLQQLKQRAQTNR